MATKKEKKVIEEILEDGFVDADEKELLAEIADVPKNPVVDTDKVTVVKTEGQYKHMSDGTVVPERRWHLIED